MVYGGAVTFKGGYDDSVRVCIKFWFLSSVEKEWLEEGEKTKKSKFLTRVTQSKRLELRFPQSKKCINRK